MTSRPDTPKPRRNLPRTFALILVLFLLMTGGIYVALIQMDMLPSPIQRQPAPFPTPAATRDERWIQDLDYLVQELPALHRNAFFATSREDFEAQAAELRAQIPALNDEQITLRLSALVASLGDGHTKIHLLNVNRYRQFPVYATWYGDELIVTSAHPDYQEALGARIVQIGDTDIETARDAVISLIAHDNEQHLKSWTPAYLRSPEILYGVGILDEMETGRYTFARPNSETFTLDVMPVSDDAVFDVVTIYDVLEIAPPVRLQGDGDYWYTYLADSGTIYFQYNRARNNEDQPFVDFNREMFAFIDANPVERVVLDVRFNGGGNSTVLNPFFDAILARPTLNTRGRLYTLIGRGTFSSAMQNAIHMKTDTNSIIVGEPTGGRPNGYGETRSFTLPNSGLEVQYSTRFFRNWGDLDAPSFPPDILIEILPDDLLNGRDPILDAAIEGRVQ
jgi:hypothetical protein